MTNTIAIFGLLVVLMAIGMPVGVALGLTVLSFMFIFTDVPLESVALKMFTGIEKFEIMAIPFFILAGNFLTHGGVARRMINFATAMVGHLRGGREVDVAVGQIDRGAGSLAVAVKGGEVFRAKDLVDEHGRAMPPRHRTVKPLPGAKPV